MDYSTFKSGAIPSSWRSNSNAVQSSAELNQTSIGSNTAAYASIATSAIAAMGTYVVGNIQAQSIAELATLNNKRQAIRQGLEMWQLNETLSDARSKSMDNKLNAQVMALQAQAQLKTQQAVTGARGASATGAMNDIIAQEQRNNALVQDAEFTMYRNAAIQQGKLQLETSGAMKNTTVDSVSGSLATLSFATDVLQIGSTIKGG